MNNIILLLLANIFVGLFFNISLNAEIVYRKAEITDCQAIMRLYDQFDEDDKEKLVLFPIEVREKILLSNIEQERMYVTVDTENNNVIAFMKHYIITDMAERNDILDNEMRFKSHAQGGAKLFSGHYDINLTQLNNFNIIFELKNDDIEDKDILEPCCYGSLDCVYIYTGSAYTVRDHRGKGIATQLINFAFDAIKDDLKCIVSHNSALKKVALLYGQLDVNSTRQQYLRPFVRFVNQISRASYGDSICLYSAAYESYKPDFVYENNTLNILPDNEKNPGQGNILVCEFGNDC